jgi:hypothetical protein
MKIRLASILIICFVLSGCENSPKIVRVDLIDQKPAALNKKPNPLLLVIGIDRNGRLSLNKIETGTTADLTVLTGKLKIIFDDREKAGVKGKEIIIDPQGSVKNDDLEKLIESLVDLKAAPIRVIKNNL